MHHRLDMIEENSSKVPQQQQQHQPQQAQQQQASLSSSASASACASASVPSSQQQYLQAGAISPGVTFSDDQYELYDSDMEPELDLGPSRETLHEGQILKSGYLHKKGERLKIWKKKWFVLRTSKLAYYKDNKEYELLRIIDIRDIHKAAEVVVKNRTGVFVILTPKRTFTVQADSVGDMEEWIQAINQAKVQHDLTSSSDIDSYSGSNSQLENVNVSSSAPMGPTANWKPELVKQGSGTLLPTRRQQTQQQQQVQQSQQQTNTLSLSDPGLFTSGENAMTRSGVIRTPESNKISGLSLGIMSQSMGQMSSGNNTSTSHTNNNNSGRSGADAGLSLVTSGVQAMRIGDPSLSSPPPIPGREELPPNSFSSNHSFSHVQGTPSSPGYGSGCEQYGIGECPNASSEEEDVVDDPTVLEAGRVAAAANAPGSGLVTGEQLESKVVRQGYLLKLGKTYKEYQPLGIIPLSTIIDCLQTDPVSKHKQYCLRIVTSKRSFLCCAPDEDTLLQWLDALHVECARVAKEAQREDDEAAAQAAQTAAAVAAANASISGKNLNEEDAVADPRAMGGLAHLDARSGGHSHQATIPTTSAGLPSSSPINVPPSRPTVTFSA
ncbi:hypothetical protein BGX28_004143 [Mortierella sp. GBA30]|nr:hypothetical protein BGX28_004143 [Mortierella sp. GBA30]